MQIDKINNFNLIELNLRKLYPFLFYVLPNNKEAIAPIKRKALAYALGNCEIHNPYINNCMDVIKDQYNISLVPDKNYEHYEIFLGKDAWVLCYRLYNDDVSIISVLEAI